jgi:hypothetical protein
MLDGKADNTDLRLAATYVVASTNGDYTDIQSALDAVGTNGATIYIADGTYIITSTLLIKRSRTRIICGGGAIIQCDGSTVSPLIKANTSGLSQITIDGGKWLQTNATAQGVCFDFSNTSNAWYRNLRIEEFGTAFVLNDTVSSTFYNSFRDSVIFNCNNGISILGTQANMNEFNNVRIRPKAGGVGIGISIVDARGLTFNHCDIEPATAAGIIGVSVDSTSREITFLNCWIENNATGVSIASGANRITFIGSSITSNTFDLSDKGANTVFINTSLTGTLKNQLGTLTSDLIVPDEAYGSGWNGSNEVPTKNAIYDKIETIVAGSGSGITRSIITISGSVTADATELTDYVYLVAGAHTVTLPTAVSNTNRYTIKNNYSAAITVDTTSSQTIDGATSIQIAPEDAVDLVSNNLNWYVV